MSNMREAADDMVARGVDDFDAGRGRLWLEMRLRSRAMQAAAA